MPATVSRWHVAKTIAGRDLWAQLRGFSLYLAVSLVLLGVTHFSLRNTLWQVEQNGLLVLATPVAYPFFLAMWLSAIYFGLMAAVAIARERDTGTLEVLFYGPVDSFSYLAGKSLQPMASALVVTVLYLVYFGAAGLQTNLGFPGDVVELVLLGLALTAGVVSLGLLVSSLSRRVFVAVLIFGGLMLLFTLVSVAHAVLVSLPGEQLTDLLAFARTVVDNVQRVLEWVSPIGYYTRGSEALRLGDAVQYLAALGSSLLYAAVMTGLAGWVLQRKGVRR